MPSSNDKGPLSSDSEKEALSSTENSNENETDSDDGGFKEFFHSLIFPTPTNTTEPVPSTSSVPDPVIPDSKFTGLKLVEKSKENDSYPSGSDEESREKRRKHPRNSCTPADLRRCLQRFESSPNYKRLKAKQFATADEYFNLKLENHHGEFDVYPPEDNAGRVVDVPGEKFASIFMNVPDIDFNFDKNELEEEQAIQDARIAARSIRPRVHPQNVKKKHTFTKDNHEGEQAIQNARPATRSIRPRGSQSRNVKKSLSFSKEGVNCAFTCISSPKRDSSSSDSDVEQRKYIDISNKSLSLKRGSGSNTGQRKRVSIVDKSSSLSKTGSSSSHSNRKQRKCATVFNKSSSSPKRVSSPSHSNGVQRRRIFKKSSSLKRDSSSSDEDVETRECFVLDKSPSSSKRGSTHLDAEAAGITDPDKSFSTPKRDSKEEQKKLHADASNSDIKQKKQHAPPSFKTVRSKNNSKSLSSTVPGSKRKSHSRGSSHLNAEQKKLPAGDISNGHDSDKKSVPCPSQSTVRCKSNSVPSSSNVSGRKRKSHFSGSSHLLAEQKKKPNTSLCRRSERKKKCSSNPSDSFK